MIITLKNKDTLQLDDFNFQCAIGKNGTSSTKLEGDKKTPKGIFGIDRLYYRKDLIKKPDTKLKCIPIKKNMGWCHDPKKPLKYNRLIRINKNDKHEKMYRKDYKYNLVVPIKYNFLKPKLGKGSAIFFHLTNNLKPTTGCIALKYTDFLIFLRLIDKNTKIKIS